MTLFNITILVAALLAVLIGCQSSTTLFQAESRTPRDQYIHDLEKSSLSNAAMVKQWVVAGQPMGHGSVVVLLPFRETGYFAAAEPQARFYRFDAKEGQVLTLTSLVKAKPKPTVFIDLFILKDTSWVQVEHADSTLAITHEFKSTNSYLVRIQPELLTNVYYSITLSVTPVLLNPVKGASNKSIGSFYGDSRDGGKRKHEGIDIFAPKGTLVVAPTDGVIQNVGLSKLGGKTVWMYDTKRSHSYYFAHLDSQIVKQGMKVKQGASIGTVGNTGNAKNTPSHLHFGVYQKRSKDPVAYIRTMERLVNVLTPDTLFQSLAFRVVKKGTSLRSGPSPKSKVNSNLDKDSWLKVLAQSGDWYLAATAEGNEGYVLKASVIAAQKGKKLVLKEGLIVFSQPDTTAAPINQVIINHERQSVELLALSKVFLFIKTLDGVTGWIALVPS